MAAAPVDAAGIVARMGPGPAPGAGTPEDALPQAGQPDLRLLARVGVVDPTSLADYRAHGGFRALERARAIGPEQVIDEVTRSGLLGRGGAAFPTGAQVGGRSQPAGSAPLPGLQRGRNRSPARSRTGCSWKAIRSRSSKRWRSRHSPSGRPRPTSTFAASTRWPKHGSRTQSRRRPKPGCSMGSTSSCGAAPAPTSAARRRRCSSRSRASAASRATSRRSRSKSACSTNRRRSTTSRRSSTSC